MYRLFATLGKPLAAAVVLVAPTSIAARDIAGNVQPAALQQTVPVRKVVAPERHPEIRKAIDALERAKIDLKRASHDFGGHRAEALEACDRAIVQLRLALQYDRK